MRREELGLGLAAVGALTIPVGCALAVEGAGALDGDARTRDRDERALPLLVRKGGRAGEGDGGPGLELGEVERLAPGDREVGDGDRGAARNGWEKEIDERERA